MHEITYEDVRPGALPGGVVHLQGGGVFRSLDLTGWMAKGVFFSDGTGLLSEVLPRPLKPGRVGVAIPMFVDCDFSGFRCPSFDPGIARFRRCRFEDVEVKATLGLTHAHFEDCVFSGTCEGNFDARPAPRDPASSVRIVGNDFTGCRGFSMQGGVGRSDNTFDPSLHLVIEKGGPGWPVIREMAEADVYLKNLVTSLEGGGPFDLGQDWAVVDQGDWPDDLWQRLRSAVAG